jgi:cytochrome c553
MTHPQRFLAALALTSAVLAAGAAMASQRIATDTGRSCTSCHDKPGSKLLTDAGKYYESMHTLDGYDQVKQSFGRCTSCHDRKPGSKKLTRRGRQFADMVKDMAGLGAWMKEGHPMPAAK